MPHTSDPPPDPMPWKPDGNMREDAGEWSFRTTSIPKREDGGPDGHICPNKGARQQAREMPRVRTTGKHRKRVCKPPPCDGSDQRTPLPILYPDVPRFPWMSLRLVPLSNPHIVSPANAGRDCGGRRACLWSVTLPRPLPSSRDLHWPGPKCQAVTGNSTQGQGAGYQPTPHPYPLHRHHGTRC